MREVVETVLDQQLYDTGPFIFGSANTYGTLDKMIASLTAIRESIPRQYRDSAMAEISSVLSYGDSNYPRIEIKYVRPETNEEKQVREAKVQAELVALSQKRRLEYERLKREFEP
jgi:hypothetical protein